MTNRLPFGMVIPVLLALCAGGIAPSTASAADGFYVGGSGAYTFPWTTEDEFGAELDLDGGFRVNGAVGYSFSPVRVEGEVSYAESDVDSVDSLDASGDVTMWSFMANGYYDFDFDWDIKPYVGFGVGVARFSVNDLAVLGTPSVDDSDTVFAFQAMAGASVPLGESVEIFAGYRYFHGADVTLTDTGGSDFDADGPRVHHVEVGLRLYF